MKWVAFTFLLLAAAVRAEGPCDQYTTRITALDQSTCILRNTTELEDAFGGFNGTRCRSTLKVTTNCSCMDATAPKINRYCTHIITYTKDENAVNVTLGYCNGQGRCSIKNIEAYWEVDVRKPEIADRLKAYPRPACVAPSIDVSPELTAVAGCEYFCYKSHNKDIDDGRPCVKEWYSASVTREPVVTLTGSCYQGICRHSASSWHPTDGVCHDRERYSKYGEILESCRHKCPDDTVRNRPNGLTCLIGKKKYTNRKIVGVCDDGSCAGIRLDDPCAMRVYYTKLTPIRVSEKCLCRGEPIANGTMCALKYSFGLEGYMLQRVGVCLGGICQERPPERPRKHKFKRSECKVEDVQVTPELVVAGGCRATCRRYETEDRPNGTLCFLRYTRDSFGLFQRSRTYHIGECSAGKCRYSPSSFYIKL
uniref:Basic tail secreted protein n=1 Tax=Rhipicephalus zambeziensis TaxID=60191 RepID=A0A224Y1X3_9ACAR